MSVIVDQELVRKWRLRHACHDAVSRWAASSGSESKALAFNAIAQDPRVLRRASLVQATRMAEQAESFAASLAESRLSAGATGRAVASYVQRSIEAWRASLKRPQPANPPAQPAKPTPDKPADPWESARRNFPYVDDETGVLATRMLHEFGAALFSRARKPWDQVISLAILRYAARRLRGEAKEQDLGGTCGPIEDILAVQAYADSNQLSPLLVGYCGPGKPIEQARSLLHDARTLRDATVSAAQNRASFWQQAVDFHAYALVALDPRILRGLPIDDAQKLATAALRYAEAAIETPAAIDLPALPTRGALLPDQVRRHAKAFLQRATDEGEPAERTMPISDLAAGGGAFR